MAASSNFNRFYDENFPPLPVSSTPLLNPTKDLNRKKSKHPKIVTQTFFTPSKLKYEGLSMKGLDIKGIEIKITCVEGGVYLSWAGTNRRIRDAEINLYVCLEYLRQHVHQEISEKIAFSKSIDYEWIENIKAITGTEIFLPSGNIEQDSVLITIRGGSENIKNASFEIKVRCKQLKELYKSIAVDKIYHPFIRGAYNENVDHLQKKFKVEIFIPPKSYDLENIIIFGENWENLLLVERHIKNVVSKMENKFVEVDFEVSKAKQHLVVGTNESGIEEVFKRTGVMIEMTKDYFSETIKLRGPKTNIEAAQSVISKRATIYSETIDLQSWIHKYFSRFKSCELKDVMHTFSSVLIEFTEEESSISILGPEDEVISVCLKLKEIVVELERKCKNAELLIDHKYITHFTPSILKELESEYEITVLFTENQEFNILIFGLKKSVKRAKRRISQKIKELEESLTETSVFFKSSVSAQISHYAREIERNFYVEIKDCGDHLKINGMPENCNKAKQEVEKAKKKILEQEAKREEEKEAAAKEMEEDTSSVASSYEYDSSTFDCLSLDEEDEEKIIVELSTTRDQDSLLEYADDFDFEEIFDVMCIRVSNHILVYGTKECVNIAIKAIEAELSCNSHQHQLSYKREGRSQAYQIYQDSSHEMHQVNFRRKKKTQKNRARAHGFSKRFAH